MYCSLFIILASLLVASCTNPFIEQILQPRTASFNSRGGSSVADQTLFRGQTINRPSNPVKDGYRFSAWYRDNNYFEYQWNFDRVPSRNITLYARWEPEVPIAGITIIAQPARLEYHHGDLLDLTGLVVTLTFEDDTSEIVAFANFGTRITAAPAHGTVLLYPDHNEVPVMVSAGGISIPTNPLTVTWAGSATIILTIQDFIDNPTPQFTVPSPITIPQSGPFAFTAVTVNLADFDNDPPVEWAISGTGIRGYGAYLTVDAAALRNYPLGPRQLTVRVHRDGTLFQGTVFVHILP